MVMRGESMVVSAARGEIYQGRGEEKYYDERADAEESAERELVLAGDGPAQGSDFAEAAAAGAFCEAALPADGVEDDDEREAEDAAEQRAEKNGDEGAAKPEKCADHGHHFDVAEAHAFAASNDFIQRGGSPEEQASESRAEEGVEDADGAFGKRAVEEADIQEDGGAVTGRDEEGEDEAGDEAGAVDGVGEECGRAGR